MASIKVEIQGQSALLMHAFPMVEIEGFKNLPINEQAEHVAYRMDGPKSNLYVPSIAVQRAFIGGAAYSKGKGRASLQKQVAACVFVSPDKLDLGTKSYIIDSRPVVIPATKGRVMRHRPRLDSWKVQFDLEYDPVLLSEKEIRKIVDDTGSRVGLLDFRPERKGPFGRFLITLWKAEK